MNEIIKVGTCFYLKRVNSFDGVGDYIHEGMINEKFQIVSIDCKCKAYGYAWGERRWWKILTTKDN